MRVCPAYPVDIPRLAGGKLFLRIQAPSSPQQPLPTQDLVNSRNAAPEAVGGVEDGAVGIRDLRGKSKQAAHPWRSAASLSLSVTMPPNLTMQFHGVPGPEGPMPQQPTHHPDAAGPGGEQVEQDIVVVAGIERDLPGAPGIRHRPHHVQGLIPIERGNLDRDDARQLDETPPEPIGEDSAAHRRLEIKAHQRDDLAHRAGVSNQPRVARIGQGAESEQSQVVPELRRYLCFTQSFAGWTDYPSDPR